MEVDVVKKKKYIYIYIYRMAQWNSYSQKPDVMSSIQGLRKLVKADSLSLSFFFLVTKHHYVHSASLVFVFFVLHPVVFRPYYQCQRG